MSIAAQVIKSYLSGRVIKFQNHHQLSHFLRMLTDRKVIDKEAEERYYMQMADVDKNYMDVCGAAVMTNKHIDFNNKTVTTYETAVIELVKYA